MSYATINPEKKDRPVRNITHTKRSGTLVQEVTAVDKNTLKEGVPELFRIRNKGFYWVVKNNNRLEYSEFTGLDANSNIYSYIVSYSAPTTHASTHENGGSDEISLTGLSGMTGANVTLDTANFDNNLSVADTTVQLALETLDELATGGGGGAMAYKYLKATTQSEGDLHLSNASWGISKAHITQIIIQTASTDWDLWILQNDNSYATNDAVIPAIQLMANGNGNLVLEPDFDYEDEDATAELHFYWVDNAGTDTVDIIVKGQELT